MEENKEFYRKNKRDGSVPFEPKALTLSESLGEFLE
jgi:hypothetical protein